MTSNDEYVLELLQERGILTQDQIDQASDSIHNPGESTLDILLQSSEVTEDQILSTVAQAFGVTYAHLDPDQLPTNLAELIQADIARKYNVVPLQQNGTTLTVAIADPMDYETLDNLRAILNCTLETIVVPPKEIVAALQKIYPISAADEIFGKELDVNIRTDGDAGDDSDDANAPVIRLVSLILMDAVNLKASDIHLEPMEKTFRIRYRIDGALREMPPPQKSLQSAIISRIKLMSNMKLSEKRIPQDGRIKFTVKGRELDLRVSTVPTNHGESIVMRILDKSNLQFGLPQLGFLADDQAKFERFISMPDGVILVTGPTGSGKTTTLYACLGQINLPDRKLITVEDPVEYQMSGINQVQVNRDVGLDFSAALRSILRQAPNIVMIGEIRDAETADIAMEAALTGHLVFSTLHTNDAPSAITRLLDIGVKPYLVASALRAAMAQRLVRAICTNCRQEHTVTDRERKLLGSMMAKNADSMPMFEGAGCSVCSNSGYKGRKGIFEIFEVDDTIQKLIFDREPATVIRARAREMGMRTLREDGMLKVSAGMTTLSEVLRATMGDAD